MTRIIDDDEEVPVETAPPLAVIDNPEAHVLGWCILDEGSTLATAIAQGLTSADFYSPAHAEIYRALYSLHQSKTPIALDTLATQLGPRLPEVGGIPYLLQISDMFALGTSTRVGHYIGKILKDSTTRREIARAKSVLEKADRGEDVDQAPVQKTETTLAVRPITSYAYPHEDDPNTLLGNDDYLGRGGGVLFVSHAGAGKSSWIMDACMMWAIGRPWMGIKCNGPLKSLIIQAEDSDRYIGKIFASFAHVNQLTPPELELLSANCKIVRLKGVSGAAFERALTELTTEHAPDLVIINPVYLYADGDISRSEFAQPFLVGLDRVNKAEKFAYILIHHTGKPAKGKDGKRPELDDWESAYMGFGSSYFANWPRCTALLEPVPTQQGRFLIKLGKGGFNAGITKQVPQGSGFRDEPVTRIAIKHSQDRMPVNGKEKPVYYWEMDTDEQPAAEHASKKGNGAAPKYLFNDYRNVFPPKSSPGMVLSELHRRLIGNKDIKAGTLHAALKRWADEGDVEILTPVGLPMRYRASL